MTPNATPAPPAPPAEDLRARIRKALGTMFDRGPGLAGTAIEVLEEMTGIRALRPVDRWPFPGSPFPEERLAAARRMIVMDTETTGKEADSRVVQLAMARVLYDEDGPLGVEADFQALRDPGVPIDPEAAQVTGISDEDVRGKSIDPAEVRAFMEGCDLVIAHHASFDRHKVERDLPGSGFESLPWICSIEHVDWIRRGSGRSLFEIATRSGLCYDAHDAMADVRALAFALASRDEDGVTVLAEARATGLRPSAILVAENSPYKTKELLKSGGFRWDAECLIHEQASWFRRVSAEELNDPELVSLVRRAYPGRDGQPRDVGLPVVLIGPEDAFSDRQRLTAENRKLWFTDPEARADLMRLMGVVIPSQDPELIRGP